jgi:hypothetical protein
VTDSKDPAASESRAPLSADEESARLKLIQAEWTRQVNLVRKQEFAYLRSVLKREGGDASERTLAGMPVRAPTADKGRSDTLKKIDEIEAQLDLLWFSSRSKRSVTGFGGHSAFAGSALLSETPALTTAPLSQILMDSTGVITQVMRHAEMPSAILLVPEVDHPTAAPAPAPEPMQFTLVVQPKAIEPSDVALSLASSLFANADYDRAAQHLLRALRDPAGRAVQRHRVLALLEIYRATGNQAQFDWSVLEYFDHWDGSTPQWHTSPASRVKPSKASAEAPADKTRFPASTLDDARIWRCPSVLNPEAARKLKAHWRSSLHCGVDWTSLSAVDPAASSELVACFSQAQGAPAKLVFVDTPNLLYVLAQATPQGQPQVARSLWDLRFCLLGLMQMRAAFDAAATDFCLTYLESAPAWKTSEIHFVGDAMVPDRALSTAPKDTPWHLSGHVIGATGLGLAELPLRPKVQRLVIDCSALVRMDTDAVEQFRQWLQNTRLPKADVHLQSVGVLVTAALASAGIDTLAQIQLRELG